MKKNAHILGLAFLALGLSTPLMAQTERDAPERNSDVTASETQTPLQMRAAQVVSIVNADADAPVDDVFTDAFLAAVPSAQLAAASRQFVTQYGKALSVQSVKPVTGTSAAIVIRMERALARGQISLDPANGNRINGLTFSTFEPINVSVDSIEADLAALPGSVSWWFGALDDGEAAKTAARWRAQMPIGSTFKLYALAALGREIAEGKRNWDDTITLPDTRSFPSGMMQDWPPGASATLETLASMMISISDNTATDALIDILGRDAVLKAMIDSGHSAPDLNDPFMKTREMFLLKSGPAGRLETFARADADLRLQVLEGIEDIPLSLKQVSAAFTRGPVALDVEWFASAADLAGLLRFMRQSSDPRVFDIMAISPNMPGEIGSKWPYAGYKGGSEPGVLNLTWLLTDETGRDHALVLSWRNDDASLDQNTMELIAQRILSLPR